ncbi:hypothetical protein LAZ67_10001142 [Cordylochernes scorpioides]|uniref:Uncharacterized protein n=1 Tax=Cordylochernes scorpioides TaxID=51811 RepID=A0ABY6KVN9_9ARAC|nr:hypothetical protein LAZ67_10001142 [Cordylochernes scorpioides]
MAVVGSITYFMDQNPVGLFSTPDPDDITEFLDMVGYKPYTHLAPYCIGMTVGYLFYLRTKLNFSLEDQWDTCQSSLDSFRGGGRPQLKWTKMTARKLPSSLQMGCMNSE